MAAGLSYRAIVELINSDNESGLKSFLETRHANVDDKHEVQTEFLKKSWNDVFEDKIYDSTKLRLKKPPLQFYFISRMAQLHSCMLLPKEAIHLYQYCLALGQIYMQRMKRSVPLCTLRQNMATNMFVMNLLNMELMYQVCKDSNAECSSNANTNVHAYHKNMFLVTFFST